MNTRPAKSGFLSTAGKVASITGFFLAVGPPVGGVVWMTSGALVGTILQQEITWRAIKNIFGAFLIGLAGMPASYVFGLVPAAIAGVSIGLLQLFRGHVGWPLVLAIGAAVGVVYFLILRGYVALKLLPELPNIFLPVAACTAASLVCWGFVQNWYSRTAEAESDLS